MGFAAPSALSRSIRSSTRSYSAFDARPRNSALAWANSPWHGSYESFWRTDFAITLGDLHLSRDLRTWVNSGLMTLFFLVVGLEAKRELDLGELRERTRLAIPVVASLGGMVTAAALYLAINAGGDGAESTPTQSEISIHSAYYPQYS